MIEFEHELSPTGARPTVVNLDSIATVEGVQPNRTAINLKDGRVIVAAAPYETIRALILQARNQFATAL